jgi:predicted Rossmann fold nucleotide-binding protein DprA/Smf involved in DNA uptake
LIDEAADRPDIRQLASKREGSVLLSCGEKSFLELVGGPPERIDRLKRLLKEGHIHERMDAIERVCRQLSVKSMVCADPRYPERLKRISSYPTVLFWRGLDLKDVLEGPGVPRSWEPAARPVMVESSPSGLPVTWPGPG